MIKMKITFNEILKFQYSLRSWYKLILCLDLLLKNDFTDFYVQNAFCKKSEMFGWDFGKCKMHSRQNAFYKFSFLEQKSESKI